uniref:Glycoside hydrolase 35 catalytic domain-containing protein n=1 Tax=Romanomermis culicivorax TaxID=13658 RepID=A0A915JKL0_ROMCU
MIVKWLLLNCLLYFLDQASTIDSIINENLKRHLRSNGAGVGLNADGPQFTLDGRPITILSGAIHYFRVPRAYWWDRLAALKSAGLNTVETYVAWNVHEEYEGQFDYS